MRGGGRVSSASSSASGARTGTPRASSAPGRRGARTDCSSSSPDPGSTTRQPGSWSERARVRKRSPATSLVRSTRSHTAGG